MDARLDAFSTPGIDTPPAFDRLRRDLHRAAGTHRVAASRTKDTIDQLKTRASFFRDTWDLYKGHGIGEWYAEMAARLERLAIELEEQAAEAGVLS